MNSPVTSLGPVEIAFTLVLGAGAIGISLWLKSLRLTRDLLIATLRCVVQLLAVGLVIGWVFKHSSWYYIVAVLAVMSFVAGIAGSQRIQRRLPLFSGQLTTILGFVTGVTLLYITQTIVRIESWNPRYLIPLGGMLLGNGMTAATLATERLLSDMESKSRDIEVYLALGGTARQAIWRMFQSAITSAMMPTINAMTIVGLVTLPGMMTGQMLGGSAPFDAAMYQILIFCGIAFSSLLSAVLTTLLVYQRFFTPADQLDLHALTQSK